LKDVEDVDLEDSINEDASEQIEEVDKFLKELDAKKKASEEERKKAQAQREEMRKKRQAEMAK
jgi:septal ring factor EnvC (AmiA/AmiB activator)